MNLPVLSLLNENACGCVGEIDSDASGDSIECICPATGLVQIIGRRYALRLLTVIGEREIIRFNDLKTTMDDMSSSTLSVRLAELESAGLLERQTFSETPPRVEYRLTEEGGLGVSLRVEAPERHSRDLHGAAGAQALGVGERVGEPQLHGARIEVRGRDEAGRLVPGGV